MPTLPDLKMAWSFLEPFRSKVRVADRRSYARSLLKQAFEV